MDVNRGARPNFHAIEHTVQTTDNLPKATGFIYHYHAIRDIDIDMSLASTEDGLTDNKARYQTV